VALTAFLIVEHLRARGGFNLAAMIKKPQGWLAWLRGILRNRHEIGIEPDWHSVCLSGFGCGLLWFWVGTLIAWKLVGTVSVRQSVLKNKE